MTVLVLLVIAVAAVAYGISKGLTAKKLKADIEADLKSWLGDSLVARDSAEAQVKAHYRAQVVKIKSFLVKYFTL